MLRKSETINTGDWIMARGLNKVMLIGRLGKDPDLKYSQGGMAVASFTLATSDSWTDKSSNEKKERTEWHRIVCFGKLGEICGEYLAKGKQVYIEGRLQTRSWEQDGVTKYTTEIVASDMQMLDNKSNRGEQEQSGPIQESRVSNQQQSQPAGRFGPNMSSPPPPGGFDDDIPF